MKCSSDINYELTQDELREVVRRFVRRVVREPVEEDWLMVLAEAVQNELAEAMHETNEAVDALLREVGDLEFDIMDKNEQIGELRERVAKLENAMRLLGGDPEKVE